MNYISRFRKKLSRLIKADKWCDGDKIWEMYGILGYKKKCEYIWEISKSALKNIEIRYEQNDTCSFTKKGSRT